VSSVSSASSASSASSVETAERVRTLAARFVDERRVVPALTVDDAGRARSWWWPLPNASDRVHVAGLVESIEPEAHARAAASLASAVDQLMRELLAARAVRLVAPRRGRRDVVTAWLAALTSLEPELMLSTDPKVVADAHAFAAEVAGWIRSGAVDTSRVRACVRVHEPDDTDHDWSVELLAQDAVEPTMLVPAVDVWRGDSPFGPDAFDELLAGLGRVVRVAPELAAFLDEAEPAAVSLDGRTMLTLARERVGPLRDAGVGVLMPSWWGNLGRVGLRAKASTRKRKGESASATTSGALGLDSVVSFHWQAALGDRALDADELAELERAAAAKRSLVRLRGEWVELDAKQLDAILAHVGQRGETSMGSLLRTGLGLDGIELPRELRDADVEVTGIDATGWLATLLDEAVHRSVAPLATPAAFAGTLRPYQERGAGWLLFLGSLGLGAVLADDMGLGKTAQLIASLVAEPLDAPTLVVCPVSVLGNWERELERFAPHLRTMVHHGPGRASGAEFVERAVSHDVVLTTYSLIARDQPEVAGVAWARLVLDEAQQVKNPGAAQTRAVAAVPAMRRIALTGTPVENRLSELWSIMNIVNPGLLGSARAFRKTFGEPIERDHDTVATERLRRVTAPFVLRRLKTDKSIITDLPDKIETTESCPLTREQVPRYQAVVDELLERAADADGMSRRGLVLAGLLRLKQVCNHPALFAGDGSGLTARSGKLTRTEELLEEIVAAGDKVLCFTQFAEWGTLLQPYLAARYAADVQWLHGGVARTSRDAMVSRFADSDRPSIFLISLKAGGTGLNLTAASHVIHLDRWWNPAVEDQATDRAFRIGQRRNVQVHKLVSSGTVEERIDAMITSKRALAERVVGTGEEWLTELDTDELRDIVALRLDAQAGE
jgi:hypothetical protein